MHHLPTLDAVRDSLRALGPSHLKPVYQSGWSVDNPTFGYCYAVSEAVYHYGPSGLRPRVVRVDGGTHWYLLDAEGNVLDYTEEQFGHHFERTAAHSAGFFKGSIKTDRGYISRSGYAVAMALGLTV